MMEIMRDYQAIDADIIAKMMELVCGTGLLKVTHVINKNVSHYHIL